MTMLYFVALHLRVWRDGGCTF